MQIGAFKPGDRARLVDFGCTDSVYRRKLLSLGVTRGVEAHIIRKAPFGCPVQVEIRGTSLTFRQNEAKFLLWEKL